MVKGIALMTIGSLCNREVVVTGTDTTVAQAAKLMREFHVGDLVVLEEGDERKPVAVVTDRDIVVAVVALDVDPNRVMVTDVAREPLEAVTEDTDLLDAVARMRQRGVRRLPVVDDEGSLLGIFTLDDALGVVGEVVDNLVALVAREIEREPMYRPETPLAATGPSES